MKYEYNEIRAAAIAADATQADINRLGEWFESYGQRYWNGEYYEADGVSLYPVYKETEPDELELIGYEIR